MPIAGELGQKKILAASTDFVLDQPNHVVRISEPCCHPPFPVLHAAWELLGLGRPANRLVACTHDKNKFARAYQVWGLETTNFSQWLFPERRCGSSTTD
jgi:3-methyladenine DNA glycosylase AlkC